MTPDDRLSAEHAIVCNCVGPTYGPAAADRTRELARRDIDWEQVVSIARWHQVRPLAYARLDATESLSVPDGPLSELRTAQRTVAQRNLLATDQLRTVARRFEDDGVAFLPFKGPVLAADAYGDVSRREFSDLDFLVRRDDAPAAMDALESLGYEWVHDVPRLDDGALLGGRFTSPLTQEYRTTHDGGKLNVELRWQVGESAIPFAVPFERLHRDAGEASIQGATVPVLDPTHRLLVLTYHGSKHHWERLKWICDVAWVLHRREFDWDDLLARASRYDNERRLLLGVALASRLFDVALPDAAAERVAADAHVPTLADQTMDRVFGDTEPSIGYLERARYVGRSHDSMTGVAGNLGRSLLEPKMHEYRLWPLPGRYHALYYLLRPFRVAWESLRSSADSG